MKNVFIKSTLILMMGTLMTKILGFFIRIIFTRIIGPDGISLYSIIMPTYSLLIAVTQLGLPYAISAIMARGQRRGINIFSSIIPCALIFDVIIIALIYFTAPFLANELLKNPASYYPIVAICFVIPFTTISGIIKGYYFGKQNMFPNAISNVFEQLARLIILVTVIPLLLKTSTVLAVTGYIVTSAISEIVQIVVYLFFAPKNFKIHINDLKPQKGIVKEVFGLSIPNVSGHIIGNISYFFEPIILTHVLLFAGYSTGFITGEYGIYNAYVIPILTMPSFFTQALNTTLIPEVSKHYKDRKYVRKRYLQSSGISLLIGLIFCIFIYYNGHAILKLMYNTSDGFDYLMLLTVFFPLFYLEGPLVAVLHGLNQAKYTMQTTLIACILKLLVMTILSLFSIGIYGLVISEIVDIFTVIYLNMARLHKLKYI